MVEEPEAERLDVQEEEEGGPIKSFLEHLEDLRWVLIKSIACAGVAMLGCLLAGNYLVRVVEWPLSRAPIGHYGRAQSVRVLFGTNELTTLHLSTNEPLAAFIGTNRFARLDLVPVVAGSNLLLTVQVHSDEAAQLAAAHKLPVRIITLTPAESFVVATKVAFFGGLIVASPFIFYFVAQFVFPALKMREKKYVYRGLAVGFGLFMIGVCFCYFVLMPVALAASAQYSEWLGFSVDQWRAGDYIGFVCKFMLGMGLGFELPVVVLTLVKLGVLNYRILASARRYVIVICFLLGAVLTTPEVITQVLMALPLLLLYELSVWVAWYWERQEKRREAEAEAAESRA
jgi:sec-independent protein translocase protein TatC